MNEEGQVGESGQRLTLSQVDEKVAREKQNGRLCERKTMKEDRWLVTASSDSQGTCLWAVGKWREPKEAERGILSVAE